MMSLFASNLHKRFVLRVLAPPLIVLLVLSVAALWRFDYLQRAQAIGDLARSADTTASKLDREFSLRDAVLQNTGAELFTAKNEYEANRSKLDSDRNACRAYIEQHYTYKGAPHGVCDPFRAGFITESNPLVGVEDEYVRLSQQLIDSQNRRINSRLSAFKQLFPETLNVVIIDSDKKLVSSAQADVGIDIVKPMLPYAEKALSYPIRGKQLTIKNTHLSVFALPIKGGSVLAAYDAHNANFLRQTWQTTPVDRTTTVVAIMDASDTVAYPKFTQEGPFTTASAALGTHQSTQIRFGKVVYTAVGAKVGDSGWKVVVASPTAALMSPVYDALFVGLIVVGLLIIGFAWVGTFFVRRTIHSIMALVSGAVIFGSGRLNYKIKLDHADQEFEQLAETMNAMATRISDAEHKIDEKNKEFISLTTHEIKTPLAIISGYLSLYHDIHSPRIKKVDRHANELVDEAYDATIRLSNMVSDMLNAARLESKQSQITLAPTNLQQIIHETLSAIRMVASINKVHLTYQEANYATVVADANLLQIVVSNFVSNAIKYNRPGGHVTISHKQHNGQLITAIADNGLGIPKSQQAHMFQKFFRVSDDDRKHVAGTGLGMYVVKAYIEQMGGKVWFESVHGKGTVFYFSLPLAKSTLGNNLKSRVVKLTRKVVPTRKKRRIEGRI